MNNIMFTFEDTKKIMYDYIYAAYYYFDQDKNKVLENINEISSGNDNALVSTFSPSITSGIISKKDAILIIRKYVDDFFVNPKYIVSSAIKSYNNERFSLDSESRLLSVKNMYGDSEYYNKKRLEYLKSIYGNIKDRSVIKSINNAKSKADSDRNISRRDGMKVCSDYSFACHIEYKFYINRYIEDNNLKQFFENTNDNKNDFESVYEFAEHKIDEELKEKQHIITPKQSISTRIRNRFKK